MTAVDDMLAAELADTLEAVRTRRKQPVADRTSPAWKRIRAACVWSADYFDLDRHADYVWLTTVEAQTNGLCGPSVPGQAAEATRRQV